MSRGRKGARRSPANEQPGSSPGAHVGLHPHIFSERLLFDFLVVAYEAVSPVPGEALSPVQCQGVAGAALCVAILMNAQVGFLDFLLRLPWNELGELIPKGQQSSQAQLHDSVSSQRQRELLNMALPSVLLDAVLGFIYQPAYAACLPPILELPLGSQKATRELVASMLDAATPLHCAALHGNAALVNYLLWHGANPLARSAAGELPLELVPACTHNDRRGLFSWWAGGQCECCCMDDLQDAACGKKTARTLLARSCITSFWGAGGIGAWIKLSVLCLLSLAGLWGSHTTCERPAVEQHTDIRQLVQRADARAKLREVAFRLKQQLTHGQELLTELAGHKALPAATSDWGRPPDRAANATNGHWDPGIRSPSGSDEEDHAIQHTSDDPYHKASQALTSFDRTLALLQVLASKEACPHFAPPPPRASGPPSSLPASAEWFVSAEDMVQVFSGLAEAGAAKLRHCQCTGCSITAQDAVQRAHRHAAYCHDDLNKRKRPAAAEEQPLSRTQQAYAEHIASKRWGYGTEALALVIGVHVRLLLSTDAAASPTLLSVATAQACIEEGEGVGVARREAVEPSLQAELEVWGDMQRLKRWAATSADDLTLAEALLGRPLDAEQCLADVLPQLVTLDAHKQPMLARPPAEGTSAQLLAAIAAAPEASTIVLHIARAAATAAQQETAAATSLRDLLAPRTGTDKSAALVGQGVAEQLTAAIQAAARFPRLQEDVAAAEAQRERWQRRAVAAASLEAVIEAVRLPQAGRLLPSAPESSSPSPDVQGGTAEEFAERIGRLEDAIEQAREAGISVSRVKKLLKDMQAQAAAGAAAAHLQAVLASRPCGSGYLKAEIMKAEAVAAAAAGSSILWEAAQALQPAIADGKRQQEVEKAGEVLARAVAASKGLADLPKLEAAIVAARKAGAHEADVSTYRSASALRSTLDVAAKARTAIDTALKALAKNGCAEDADAAEAAASAAEQGSSPLLQDDVAAARSTVASWRAATAAEARLERLLRDGTTPGTLSRVIQEAAAAGVKVGEARRVLKLLQGLESAVSTVNEGQHAALKTKLDAALASGVMSPLVQQAQAALEHLRLTQVKALLEAALNPHLDITSNRSEALREALERAEPLLHAHAHTQDRHGSSAPRSRAGSTDVIGSSADDTQYSGSEIDAAGSGKKKHASANESHVTTSRADSASSIFALEARSPADLVEEAMEGPEQDADLAAVRSMAEEARRRLDAQARDQVRITEERNRDLAARREQQQVERERRERERAERMAADRAEKERLEKEKAERRAERARMAQEQAAQAEHARRQQSLMEQLDRQRKEAAATAQASVPPAQSTQPAAASNAPPVLWIPPSQASSTSASHGGDVDTVVLEAAMAEWRAAHQGQDDVAGLSLLLQQQEPVDSPSASSSSTATNPWGNPNVLHRPPAVVSSPSDDLMRMTTPRVKFEHDLGGAAWGRDTPASTTMQLQPPPLSSALNTFPSSTPSAPGECTSSISTAFTGFGWNGAESPAAQRQQDHGWRVNGSFALAPTSPRSLFTARGQGFGSMLLKSEVAGTGPQPQQQQQQQLARTLKVQRPCRYFQQGYCRDGAECRFAHSVMPAVATQPLPAVRVPVHHESTAPLFMGGAGGFAFGAPGSAAFSAGLDQVAASQPRPEPSASNLLMSLSAAQDLSTKAAHTTSAQLYPHMGPTLPYRPLASGTPPLQHAALQGSAVRPAALLAPSAHGWGHSLADGLHDRTSFHAEWSMPEQLPAFSEARAELQQQQQQQPEQAPLQQHDFFAHDPAMLSIWQGQQPASSAPSPFHFKAVSASGTPSPAPSSSLSSELKASAAEFVPWSPSFTAAPSTAAVWNGRAQDAPLLSLPSDLSISPNALMGELHSGRAEAAPVLPQPAQSGDSIEDPAVADVQWRLQQESGARQDQLQLSIVPQPAGDGVAQLQLQQRAEDQHFEVVDRLLQ